MDFAEKKRIFKTIGRSSNASDWINFIFCDMSIQKFTGIIAGATTVERFEKKDGTKNQSAVLHLMEISKDPHPLELAVKVTGELVNYAACVGMTVEVEYINRVFVFRDKQTNRKCFGNDVYAHAIRIMNADRSAMLNQNEKEE